MYDIEEAQEQRPQRRRRRKVWILERESREALAATVGPTIRKELGLPAGEYLKEEENNEA